MNFPLNRRQLLWSFLFAFFMPGALFAHHAEWMNGKPFVQGLSMPVHGLDHMMVTIAVGLIAVQIGDSALWAIPAAFSLLLLLGGIMNVSGLAVPFAEQAIFASVIVIGGLLVYHRRFPVFVGLALVAFFSLFHGAALVGEGPHNGWFFVFAAGCLIASWAVLGSGMAVGLILKRLNRIQVIRYAGWAMISFAAVIAVFPNVNDAIIHLLE
jgi:urease accessory protein